MLHPTTIYITNISFVTGTLLAVSQVSNDLIQIFLKNDVFCQEILERETFQLFQTVQFISTILSIYSNLF